MVRVRFPADCGCDPCLSHCPAALATTQALRYRLKGTDHKLGPVVVREKVVLYQPRIKELGGRAYDIANLPMERLPELYQQASCNHAR